MVTAHRINVTEAPVAALTGDVRGGNSTPVAAHLSDVRGGATSLDEDTERSSGESTARVHTIGIGDDRCQWQAGDEGPRVGIVDKGGVGVPDELEPWFEVPAMDMSTATPPSTEASGRERQVACFWRNEGSDSSDDDDYGRIRFSNPHTCIEGFGMCTRDGNLCYDGSTVVGFRTRLPQADWDYTVMAYDMARRGLAMTHLLLGRDMVARRALATMGKMLSGELLVRLYCMGLLETAVKFDVLQGGIQFGRGWPGQVSGIVDVLLGQRSSYGRFSKDVPIVGTQPPTPVDTYHLEECFSAAASGEGYCYLELAKDQIAARTLANFCPHEDFRDEQFCNVLKLLYDDGRIHDEFGLVFCRTAKGLLYHVFPEGSNCFRDLELLYGEEAKIGARSAMSCPSAPSYSVKVVEIDGVRKRAAARPDDGRPFVIYHNEAVAWRDTPVSLWSGGLDDIGVYEHVLPCCYDLTIWPYVHAARENGSAFCYLNLIKRDTLRQHMATYGPIVPFHLPGFADLLEALYLHGETHPTFNASVSDAGFGHVTEGVDYKVDDLILFCRTRKGPLSQVFGQVHFLGSCERVGSGIGTFWKACYALIVGVILFAGLSDVKDFWDQSLWCFIFYLTLFNAAIGVGPTDGVEFITYLVPWALPVVVNGGSWPYWVKCLFCCTLNLWQQVCFWVYFRVAGSRAVWTAGYCYLRDPHAVFLGYAPDLGRIKALCPGFLTRKLKIKQGFYHYVDDYDNGGIQLEDAWRVGADEMDAYSRTRNRAGELMQSVLKMMGYTLTIGTAVYLFWIGRKRWTREEEDGYCYMRAMEETVDLGQKPTLAFLDLHNIKPRQKDVYVTDFSGLLHLSYAPLTVNSVLLADYPRTPENLQKPVGSIPAVSGLMLGLYAFDKVMYRMHEGTYGYCYIGATVFPGAWMLGPWPYATLVAPLLDCSRNYTVSSVPGIFHIEEGGNTTCHELFSLFRSHSGWRVGGRLSPIELDITDKCSERDDLLRRMLYDVTTRLQYLAFELPFCSPFIVAFAITLCTSFLLTRARSRELVEKWCMRIFETVRTGVREPIVRRRWRSGLDLMGAISYPFFGGSDFLRDVMSIVLRYAFCAAICHQAWRCKVNEWLYIISMVSFYLHTKGSFTFPEFVFYACGTTGDNLPIKRYVDRLKALGVFCKYVELLDPLVAKHKLAELERGGGLPAADSLATAYYEYLKTKRYGEFSIVPWTLRLNRVAYAYDLSPAPYNRGPFRVVNDTNPFNLLLNFLVNCSNVSDPHFRIGDFYHCPPRLKRSYEDRKLTKTNRVLVTLGSSSLRIDDELFTFINEKAKGKQVWTDDRRSVDKYGWLYQHDTNHDMWFQEFDVIFCHGGSGTMQTALAARSEGAEVYSLSEALDRQWCEDPIMYRQSENYIVSLLGSYTGPAGWLHMMYILVRGRDVMETLRLMSYILSSVCFNVVVPAVLLANFLGGGLSAHIFAERFWQDLHDLWPTLGLIGIGLSNFCARIPPESVTIFMMTTVWASVAYVVRLLEPKRLVWTMILGPITVVLVELSMDITDIYMPWFYPVMFTAFSYIGCLYRCDAGVTYIGLMSPIYAGWLLPIPWHVVVFNRDEYLTFADDTVSREKCDEAFWMRRDIAIPVPGLTLEMFWSTRNVVIRDYKAAALDLADAMEAESWMMFSFFGGLGLIFVYGLYLMTWKFCGGVFVILAWLLTLTLCIVLMQLLLTAWCLFKVLVRISQGANRPLRKVFKHWNSSITAFGNVVGMTAKQWQTDFKDHIYHSSTLGFYWEPVIAYRDTLYSFYRKAAAFKSRMGLLTKPFRDACAAMANSVVRFKTQWAPYTPTIRKPRLYNGRLGFVVSGDPRFVDTPFREVLSERLAILRMFKRPGSKVLPEKNELVRKVRCKTTLPTYEELTGPDALASGADGLAFASKETMIASLSEYTQKKPEPLDEARCAKIAQAIYDQCPEKFEKAEVADPRAVARLCLKKKKMSAGLDFDLLGCLKRRDIKSGGFFGSLVEAGVRPFKTGVFRNALFHTFPKSQIVSRAKLETNPAKLRSITATTLADNVTQGILCLDLNKRKPDYECWSKAGMPSTGFFMNKIFDKMSHRRHVYSLDVRAFDRNLNDSLIRIGTKIQQLAYKDHPDADLISKWLDCLQENKKHGYIVNLVNRSLDELRDQVSEADRVSWEKVPQSVVDEIKSMAAELIRYDPIVPGGYLKKIGGGATGDFNVTYTNTIACQAFVIDVLCTLWGIEPAEFSMYADFANVSDDNMLGVDRVLDIRAFIALAKSRHGIDVKIESKGTTILDQTFLAKIPRPAEEYASEFADAGIEMPKFAILHDHERLLRSIAQTKISDQRKSSLTPNAFKKWEVDRLCGMLYNCVHYKEQFQEVHELAWKIRNSMKRYRGKVVIPTYNEVLKNFYSDAKLEKYLTVKKITLSHKPEQVVHDYFLVHARCLAVQARSTTWGDLGEFPEFRAPHAEVTTGFFEPFMWLCFRCEASRSPTAAELASMCDRSAFSAFCNAKNWLITKGDMYEALTDSEVAHELHAETWRMIVYTIVYQLTSQSIAFLNHNNWTRIVMYISQVYRYDLPQLFAALSHVHFLGRGTPSAGLSNLMPKDRHHYIKRLTLVVTRIVPVPKALAVVPVHTLLSWIAKVIDGLGYMPTISLTTEVACARVATGSPWEDTAVRIATLFEEGHRTVVVTSPCGAGKTRYLPDALLAPNIDGKTKPWKRVMVVMPRRILCQEYTPRKPGTFWKEKGVSRVGSHMVCTYGYLGTVICNGPAPWFKDTLFIFDESHENSVDWVYLFKKMEGSIRSVLLTATPLTWMEKYPLIRVKVKAPFDVKEEKPLTADLLDEFLARVSTSKRILVIHPSEKKCIRIVSSLCSMGYTATLLSANQTLIPDSGHVVATSVADSSLTLAGCDCVIDSGLSMVNQTGQVELVTFDRATMIQRRGRTGRTCNGIYVPLKQPVKSEYGVCPSLDQVLCGSHYLELFDVTVNLDKCGAPYGPNRYMNFTQQGTREDMAAAELYAFADWTSDQTGKETRDVYKKMRENNDFAANWMSSRNISELHPYTRARTCFEVLKPYYQHGANKGCDLTYYQNKIELVV